MSETSPFIAGARVAINERWGDNVTEGRVEKVYKSGNFTLQGSAQQWRPWSHTPFGTDSRRWSAMETGSGYNRRCLDIWDDTTDAEIRTRIEATRTRTRWHDLRRKVDVLKQPTSALCDAVEAALAAFQEEQRP